MARLKLVLLVWVVMYALVTLMLFSNLTWAVESHSQVDEFGADTLPSQVEADSNTYHDEPSRARSRSQHRSSKGRNPVFPGGPGLAMTPTVSGWVFCSSCMSVSTPLLGIEAQLLCPHPPPGGGGPGLHGVSSTVTGKDGSFHLIANVSYASIMNRCAVIISKSSNTNCDMPPPTGTSIPVSTSSTSSEHASGPDVLHYSLSSFSFRPASCAVGKTKAGNPRTLLQDGEDPLGMEQGPEKNHNHKSTRSPISGSDPHGGNEEPALLTHPIKHSYHHNKKDKRTKQAAGALKLPPFLLKSKAMHARTSLPKSLMMVNPSKPPTLHTSSRRHNRGGGPPTSFTDSRRHSRGGPPHSDSDIETTISKLD